MAGPGHRLKRPENRFKAPVRPFLARWMISRGSDRVALRSTLEDAREQARRLSAFDDVKSQGQA